MIERKHIQAVVADIDGTMVNDQRILSARTKRAIEMLHENGIAFGIASGRDYHQLLDDEGFWGFQFHFDVVIGMNGGQVYTSADQKVREYDLMQPDTVRRIIEMMEPLDLNPFVYGPNHTMICKRIDQAAKASGERNDMTIHVVKSLDEFWQRPLPKIMYRTPLERMPEVEKWADSHPSDDYQSFKTQTTMLEFTDPKVNKGRALKKYAELSGIPLENIMTFGDMTNDNELLRTAGAGICLKNGNADTISCADDVTPYTNNEDGMARYIEEYFGFPAGSEEHITH